MKYLLFPFLFPFRLVYYLYISIQVFFRKGTHLTIKIPNKFAESEKSFLLDLVSGKDSETFFLNFINLLIDIPNSNIKKISFIVGKIDFGFSELEEICSALKLLKEKKIKLSGFSHEGDLKTIYLLSYMDERYSSAGTEFLTVLPAFEGFYLGNFFKKLGIQMENYASGKYKSFGEMFSKDKMSKEAKENLQMFLTSFYNTLDQKFKSNGFELKDIAEFISTNSEELFQMKFFDKLMDIEEFEKRSIFDNKEIDIENKDIEPEYSKAKSNYINFSQKKKKFKFLRDKADEIVFLSLKGNITQLNPNVSEQKEGEISPAPILSILREFREKDSVKALVLSIDSGGGSATGSDVIYRELEKFSKVKPTYAYFQNAAASGGYYIGVGCKKIYASPFSITGSIGSVMIRPNLKGLYDKLGIKKDRVGFYPTRELLSEYGEPTIEGKKFLQREIKRVTGRFYEVVMKSRNISLKDLIPKAEGRIFSGADFLNLNMVDSNKTLRELFSDIQKELNLKNPTVISFVPISSFRSVLKEFKSGLRILSNPERFLNGEKFRFESELANWFTGR
ncbi:MAG: S49 family peptidase [Leptospiraceae bacterium]|nr:S49 family peptidase [Leptospiraceae bacterium]